MARTRGESDGGLKATRPGNQVARPRHYTRGISPLMVRILAVNALAIFTLVGGILYLNQFRTSLIHDRRLALEVQAQIIAAALGESASAGPEATEIDLPPARQILSRLVSPTDVRARLFGVSGSMIADSRLIAGEKRVYAEPLPRLDSEVPLSQRAEALLRKGLEYVAPRPLAPPYIDKPGLRAADLIEVMSALEGEPMSQVRQRDDGGYAINVAMPVQRFRRVLGALLLTAQTDDIERIVQSEQMLIVQISSAAFILTILLSLFLGQALVRPIRVLARAAERVRGAIGREENIPEFADRKDEIGDLSRSLSDMTRALYNQIDAVESFAADVAHELKNPLSSMRSALETMKRTDRPDLHERLLGILAEDVQRLDRLISDISDASRLDAELTRGAMEPVDIGTMLATMIDGYRTTGVARGVKIAFDDPEPGAYVVNGIGGRLGQVWRNIIDNAISFSPEGGTVTVTLARGDRRVTTYIMDEGPGLPEGAEEKIFSRFYSERPEGEDFGRHSGLGLAISKQVIEAHRGQITATNRTDRSGALFIIDLPASKNAGTKS
ncbi:stimulus-sensing domain-containing protein [Pseudokordiimonas caeni]|uniref:stimulus-sensing domain-containing protein n=1 Tax=Pseudokordiimonas caeni TaxID=2997908 RepID=UPI00281265D1|nr:stimulus-sensing domain-containing protein [Pseudokordiimonas caeni]